MHVISDSCAGLGSLLLFHISLYLIIRHDFFLHSRETFFTAAYQCELAYW